MYHSNIKTGTAFKIHRALSILQALPAKVRSAFHYSPEDKFVETKKAADQLEALYKLEAKGKLEVGEEQEISDTDTPKPHFTFWV